ncbi:hypothetical protein [Cellulosilyticum ruminicola]|uniref:hypothetical protein n=1 Tax=Cellulosilyticum ruminicola TaxID=425254 RepID=UPI0006CFCE71|nr:hypothetical protein [Cellulosilyticum ruminicola]
MYHKKKRIKYQQEADKRTQKLVDAKFKKINLEEKQKERAAEKLKRETEKQEKAIKKLDAANKNKTAK